jgi:uncharacterized lipoprotein
MRKMKGLIVASLVFGLISGCGTIEKVISKGAEVNDKALNAAEFTICKGATVGSIRRHYSTAEQAKVWRDLCNSIDDFSPEEIIGERR